MKYKFSIILLLTFIFSNGHAQERVEFKCPLSIDKESGRDIYENVDSRPVFAALDPLTDTLFITMNFKLKKSAIHNDIKWVQLVYIVEKDGTSTFLRVIKPKDDKQIEEEAKRIISIMPLHNPARCNHSAVPYLMTINFQTKPY